MKWNKKIFRTKKWEFLYFCLTVNCWFIEEDFSIGFIYLFSIDCFKQFHPTQLLSWLIVEGYSPAHSSSLPLWKILSAEERSLCRLLGLPSICLFWLLQHERQMPTFSQVPKTLHPKYSKNARLTLKVFFFLQPITIMLVFLSDIWNLFYSLR